MPSTESSRSAACCRLLRRPWPRMEDVELATLAWVDWYNHRRLLSSIAYRTPAQAEADYYQHTKCAARRRVIQTKQPPAKPGRFKLGWGPKILCCSRPRASASQLAGRWSSPAQRDRLVNIANNALTSSRQRGRRELKRAVSRGRPPFNPVPRVTHG